MREKLIELLTYLLECELAGDCSALAKEWADRLIANGVVVSKMETTTKWIPVTERLPEKHEYILALTPNKIHGGYYKWLIWYDPKSGFYDSDPEWGDIEMDDVTHWMPLPSTEGLNEK
jgi:hypothetical protein